MLQVNFAMLLVNFSMLLTNIQSWMHLWLQAKYLQDFGNFFGDVTLIVLTPPRSTEDKTLTTNLSVTIWSLQLKISLLPDDGGSGEMVNQVRNVRCVNSKKISPGTNDGSMRGGINVGDKRVLICFQLVFTKRPTTALHKIAEGLPSFITSLVSTSCGR
jgi:hypothetical protein